MTSVMLYKVLDRDGKPLMVDGEIEQFTLGVANQRAHSIGGRYLPIRDTEIVTTPAQQATFITVTVTLKMTPEQRTLYAYGRTDGPDTAPDDVAGRVRARIGEALAEPWIRRFTHASVGEPKIEDLPRSQHRCQQGKHCGGCGCRGCRYDAPPSLFDPEPELPAALSRTAQSAAQG